ncbi:chloramphenicol acetyltransferase [Chryseobacterium indoltheticum]|jgi:chloramphenicol O-acetyltransferase type A|uniref:chloramphenicol acetyltransferase n=1 Tax=Chryseobacterium indoltheticum TaxID=254 RepID=UPI002430ECDF|nr:chloramphenicol acetyltransferase [Chryseobacterium indoltheticum]MDF2831862.1 chloramphenicol acetyltransferase [Chryseobacterium indoltheticum]
MKQLITLDNWKRKDHFLFFSKFEEPFFGVTINIDCTLAYQQAKEKGNSFFLYYLYRALKAANKIENFRYRIIDKEVYLFDQINASATINRPDETFGFSYMDYDKNEELFYQKAKEEIARVQQSKGLIPAGSGENVIHFSAVPWLDFTSLSHARSFTFPDSCPKISFGKVTENNGKKLMSVSIHAHHGLMDGFHIGLFAEKFQELMNEN